MMSRSLSRLALSLLLALVVAPLLRAQDDGFRPLFNGKNLDGWVNVNCAPQTWTVKDGKIYCTGVPTGGSVG